MDLAKLFAAIVFALPLGVSAQKVPTSNINTAALPPSFTAIDQNKDGYITRDEAKKAGISNINFDAADKNKDGKLNLSEWTLVKFN